MKARYIPGDPVWLFDRGHWREATVRDIFDDGSIMVERWEVEYGHKYIYRQRLGWWGQRRRVRPRTDWKEVA